MLVEDRASVEAVPDERDPSRLRIDIRVHPVGGGSLGSEAGEIQRLIRDGFRDALREAQLDRPHDGQGNGNNDDGCQPGLTGDKQGEREMKERFHSFVVPQIRKFGQMAPPN